MLHIEKSPELVRCLNSAALVLALVAQAKAREVVAPEMRGRNGRGGGRDLKTRLPVAEGGMFFNKFFNKFFNNHSFEL